MSIRTAICEMLGIEVPICGFTPSPEVAAALSRAGGLGVLGAVRYSDPAELEAALDRLEAMIPAQHRAWLEGVLTEFGVGELPPEAPTPSAIVAWMHDHARRQVELAFEPRHREAGLCLLVNALGSPPADIIARAHASGIKVAALAGKAKHARGHVDAGVDIVVAVGTEAGGHTGDVATMVIVPEIVDAVAPTPVLAAGGIGCGRQVAAALALGADGVWMGSVWLTSAEYKLERPGPNGISIVGQKLLDATSSDTVRSRVISGKPARMLRTPWTEAWEAKGSPGTLPMPMQGMLVAAAEARIRHHQSEPLLGVPVGQIVGRMNEIRPVADIVASLVSEFGEATARVVAAAK